MQNIFRYLWNSNICSPKFQYDETLIYADLIIQPRKVLYNSGTISNMRLPQSIQFCGVLHHCCKEENLRKQNTKFQQLYFHKLIICGSQMKRNESTKYKIYLLWCIVQILCFYSSINEAFKLGLNTSNYITSRNVLIFVWNDNTALIHTFNTTEYRWSSKKRKF
jgi:hypothetical protein